MVTREDIKKARNKILAGIAGAAVVVGGATYAANKLFKDAKKNEVENTVSGKSYKDHNLSFEERIAALDEAVKKGDVIVKAERAAGMIEGEFRTKEGELVATSYGAQINDVNGLEKWPVQFDDFAVFEIALVSENPSYKTVQNSVPVTVEAKKDFRAVDHYSGYPEANKAGNGYNCPGFHLDQTEIYNQQGKLVDKIEYDKDGKIVVQKSTTAKTYRIPQQGR